MKCMRTRKRWEPKGPLSAEGFLLIMSHLGVPCSVPESSRLAQIIRWLKGSREPPLVVFDVSAWSRCPRLALDVLLARHRLYRPAWQRAPLLQHAGAPPAQQQFPSPASPPAPPCRSATRCKGWLFADSFPGLDFSIDCFGDSCRIPAWCPSCVRPGPALAFPSYSTWAPLLAGLKQPAPAATSCRQRTCCLAVARSPLRRPALWWSCRSSCRMPRCSTPRPPAPLSPSSSRECVAGAGAPGLGAQGPPRRDGVAGGGG